MAVVLRGNEDATVAPVLRCKDAKQRGYRLEAEDKAVPLTCGTSIILPYQEVLSFKNLSTTDTVILHFITRIT